MFQWIREQAPVAEERSIPVLSQEEMEQVSGAGFMLVEDAAPPPPGFMLVE